MKKGYRPTQWGKKTVNVISEKGIVSRLYKELLQLNHKNTTKLKTGPKI